VVHPHRTKKLNKMEGQSEDVSIPLRKGNKIIMGGRERDGPGWEGRREGKGSGLDVRGNR